MPALSDVERATLLGRTSIFQGIDPELLVALAPATRLLELTPGESLFHKGDPGSDLYVVVHGRLKALTTGPSGDQVVFSIMGPGEVIGEIAALSEATRSASVEAMDACELLTLRRADLLEFLQHNADASVRLLGVMAQRLRRVSELLEDMHFLNLPFRLAKKLSAAAQDYGQKTPGGIRINLRLSQDEWGELVGTSRESINKQFRAWSAEGIVRVDRGFVIIEDLEEIERIARLPQD